MRKTIAFGIALMFVATLFVFTPSTVATKPEDVNIFLELSKGAPGTAYGIFDASGAVDDYGYAEMTYRYAGKTIHANVNLESGQGKGEIFLHFQGLYTEDDEGNGLVSGRFTITHGTGDYEFLHGVGAFDGWYDEYYFYGLCLGKAHYDE
jgi:hypothetical protein